MTKRTDTHRPSAIDPGEYTYIGPEVEPVEVIGMDDNLQVVPELNPFIGEELDRLGATWATHKDRSNCHVCGASVTWTVVFHHVPTNTFIRMGRDCAYKMHVYDSTDWNAFKKVLKERKEAVAGKNRARKTLAEAGMPEAWDTFITISQMTELEIREACPVQGDRYVEDRWVKMHATIRDLIWKMVRYGDPSDKQVNFLKKLLADRDGDFVKWANDRIIKEARRAEAPTGKTVVTGVILSTKIRESDFGSVRKMLVEDDKGFKVWCTVPNGLTWMEDPKRPGCLVTVPLDRGTRVQFNVTLQPSKDDPKFAFGKRPTKATVLQAVTA